MLNKTGSLFLQTALYLANLNPKIEHTNFFNRTEAIHRSADDIVINTIYNVEKGTDVAAKCYGELGCYSINPPWTDISRPVSQYPESPEKVKPKYCLYTRHNKHFCQELIYSDSKTIYRSFLVPTHKVYFIAHGFLENADRNWIRKLTAELLANNDVNVITVDWGFGSSPPYTQAVANIRLVGTITALLINTMSTKVGVQPEFCHVIGHSLGAHLAGYVGNILQTKFNRKLGRITGLDPAEPHFSKTDPIVRLDPTDANFVDIIHTDATPFIEGGLGMDEPIGHLDFYPNGGENQPGCDKGMMNYIQQEKNSFIKGIRKFLGCDHVRSLEYFTESVNTQCQFLAVECDSWKNFIAGECFDCDDDNRVCAHLGMNSFHTVQRQKAGLGIIDAPYSRSMVKLFTITQSEAPFCRALYRVTVIISNSTESIEYGGEIGLFAIELKGVNGDTGFINLFREQHFVPGSKHRQVVAGINVGRIKTAVLKWEHRMTMNILTWRFGKTLIHLHEVHVDTIDEPRQRIRLCTYNYVEPVYSSVPVNLHNCNDMPKNEI
ncbi:pancreatic lipase-related protein 2-like [Lycorma delicatula]|uniref:pancreatic lipase-related protein 2-like n=1 Tax=Lycorma delicatula TaxID=130591 RepID=UPI003F519A08